MENDGAVVVSPIVTVLDDQSWLMVDASEHQVRLYRRTGELVAAAGGRGEGPGEFQMPLAAGRFADGTIWVADLTGSVSIFGPSLDVLLDAFRMPVAPVYSARTFKGDSLLVAGRTAESRDLIHVVDSRSGSIARSFFAPDQPAPQNFGDIAAYASFAGVALSGDTLATFISTVDTIYYFNFDGSRLGAVPLPALRYRALAKASSEERSTEPRDLLQRFSSLTYLEWLANCDMLLQYADLIGREQRNTLVRMTRIGTLRFEIETPRAVAVWHDTIATLHPSGVEPNKWLIATLPR